MFLVLNSVSPHDFNSPSEFLSRCRHVGATPGHIFHTLASDPLFMAIPGILFVFPESTIFIDALMTACFTYQKKHNNHLMILTPPQNSSVDAGMLVRLRATFFTLWLVIPYSWQFPAYFSFFQSPLSLLMH